MVKKVLFIAYHWPPSNAAGAHRPLRFARYLRQFGWEPVVLTADPPCYQRYDPKLLEIVPENLMVVRAPHRDPWLSFQQWRAQSVASSKQSSEEVASKKAPLGPGSLWRRSLKRTISWLECRLYHPDIYMHWVKSAVDAAARNFRASDFQAIFATGNPWSDFEVGYQLSRKWGVPLILDFRDAWTVGFYEFGNLRPGWARAADRRRLSRYLAAAQSVIFLHGPFAESYLRAYSSSLQDKQVHLIPNGFELDNLDVTPFSPGTHLSVVYAGALSYRRYDTLFSALGRIQSRENGPLNLKITFIGESNEGTRRLAQELGIVRELVFFSPMSYETTQQKMREAHALLLLGEPESPGYELHVSSKIFQYLSIRRPILGILPPNEALRLLKSLGAGPLADVDSVTEIEQAILSLHQAWESRTLARFLPPLESLKEYMEPDLSEALTRALGGQAPQRPYRRGDAPLPPSLQHDWK